MKFYPSHLLKDTAIIFSSPSAITSSIQLVSFYKTFSWSYLPCQLLLFLLSFETKHFPVILFTFITSHFSLLTFSPRLTQARLLSHHSIKTYQRHQRSSCCWIPWSIFSSPPNWPISNIWCNWSFCPIWNASTSTLQHWFGFPPVSLNCLTRNKFL